MPWCSTLREAFHIIMAGAAQAGLGTRSSIFSPFPSSLLF